jgi:putative heme-binding domain-containing protein
LVVALTRAAGLSGSDTELSKAEMMKLAESVLNRGDAARGERIFRSQQQSCATCHAIGGVGGHVGPDLTSIGASAQLDYLIESVYYPNKEIKDGFHSTLIETRDGEELAGIKCARTTANWSCARRRPGGDHRQKPDRQPQSGRFAHAIGADR